ncbi:MAG: pre-mRNA-splicing factor syf2 [Trizodia sp. TS-e1964]|nr:MAG: pre-mRNA-splicing factor syf2 [Trizodia sp. TS-e1964]
MAAQSSEEPAQPSDIQTESPAVSAAAAAEDSSKEASPEAPQQSNTIEDRKARFKALQAKAKLSAQTNLKEAAAESQRLATDPALLSTLARKHAFASHALLKADVDASGASFERKRAWDWTIDESLAWDARLDKKARHRADVAFQDYTQDARKVYKRQLRAQAPDVAAYEAQKAAAVQRAAASGNLEIVETEDGELVAVDRNGTFYSSAESTEFVGNRPEKEAVERLVRDLQKAEETRLKKRKERSRNEDEGDVTYINEKNRLLNKRLERFYNKYTTEIRDSFERGTMI